MSEPDDLLAASVDTSSLPDLGESLDLLGRAQDGDDEALGDLLARYQERLLRIVRIELGAHLRPHMESMDIVQDTWRVALRKLSELRPTSHASILRWLATLAVHQIHDAHDKAFAQKRDPRREVPLDASAGRAPTPVGDATAPPQRAHLVEVRALLDEAVAELAPDHRDVIVARDYCGADWGEVAALLGKESAHAARQVHRRAWIKVRGRLWPRLKGDG